MKKKFNMDEKELKQNPIMVQIESIKVLLNYNELPGTQFLTKRVIFVDSDFPVSNGNTSQVGSHGHQSGTESKDKEKEKEKEKEKGEREKSKKEEKRSSSVSKSSRDQQYLSKRTAESSKPPKKEKNK